MRIELVQEENDDICENCEEMIYEIEDFINWYIESNECGEFTLELFADKLIDLFVLAKESGKREAFESIGNIAMNLAYPNDDDECDCCNEDSCDYEVKTSGTNS